LGPQRTANGKTGPAGRKTGPAGKKPGAGGGLGPSRGRKKHT
jgi:hypothetical protein